jgi:hypothetical protein
VSDEKNKIKLFEEKQVRAIWDEDAEKWWFSVVDIIAVLTEQPDYRSATKYWNTTKTRLLNEGSQLSTNCGQLKMKAADGNRCCRYRTGFAHNTIYSKQKGRAVLVVAC